MARVALLFLALSSAGCGRSSLTDTSSASLPTLAERVEFLEHHVTFRRSYRELDFHIHQLDNSGGMVPAPSEYDIRLIAVVPPEEVALWVPANVGRVPKVDAEWLSAVPGAERAEGITEWYEEQGKVVGVDRARSLVAYRVWKR